MEGRHGTGLDVAAQPRTHDELVSLTESLDEGSNLTKVVGAVRVAEDQVVSANKGQCVDVGTAESAARDLQHTGTFS